MKNKKIRRLKFFGSIDTVAIAEYLESMAEKGYFFTGCTGIFYTFKKADPQEKKYHVELFHDGSIFGSAGDNEETKVYAARWEEKGWKYIYANGRQIFFMAEDMDAEPLNAEPKEQWNILKKCITGDLTSGFIWILLCLANLLRTDSDWPTEFIEFGTLDLVWILLLVFWIGSVLRNLLFYVKNRQRAAKGQSAVFPKGTHAVWFNSIIVIFLLLAVVIFLVTLFFESKMALMLVLISIAIISVTVWFGIKLMRRIGCKKTKVQQIIILVILAVMACVVSIGVAFVALLFDGGDRRIQYLDEYGNTITESVSDDEIPLMIDDLGIDISELIQADTECYEYVTIYGTVKDCYQHYYDNHGEIARSLTYNIADCRFNWVKDKLLENYMTTDYYGEDAAFMDISEKEAALWEAQQVYTLKDGSGETSRLVIYEDVVLFIGADAAFTDEVIKRIRMQLADRLE